MEHESRNERQQNIAEGSGGKNIGEVGPGEGSVVSDKKSEQKQNPQSYPGIGDGKNDGWQVVEGDIADFLHAPRKQCFTHGRADGHADQHQIFSKGHANFLCWLRLDVVASFFPFFLDPLVPLRPGLEECFGFLVKPFAVIAVEGRSSSRCGTPPSDGNNIHRRTGAPS